MRHAFARFATLVKDAVSENPELTLPVFLLFIWQITAIAVNPRILTPAILLTAVLFLYSYRVLGNTPWLRRLGWSSPCRGFWLYSVLAGIAAALAVWRIAGVFHQSLGGVSPPYRLLLASSSGAILEELLFRGLFFWLILALLSRVGVSGNPASTVAVLLIATGFAFAHVGRTGIGLYMTLLTGIAFGWMRVRSQSTAAAALMHGVYNLALSCLATF